MSTRTLALAFASASILAAAPVFAASTDEVVPWTYRPTPARVVAYEYPASPFGAPNRSEFPVQHAASLDRVTAVPYPHAVYAFGLPSASETCPPAAGAPAGRVARLR